MTDPVFYAPTVQFEGTSLPLRTAADKGRVLTLSGEEGKHAVSVQRLRGGEHVDLVDGEGFRVQSRVDPAGSGSTRDLTVIVRECSLEALPATTLTLVQALAKGGRDEQAIETATELGVDRVIPWQAERSVVRLNGKKKSGPLDRWQRVLIAAMKQSRRATLPTLGEALTSGELEKIIGQKTDLGALVLICHESANTPISKLLSEAQVPTRNEVVLVVGPEGGITDQELDRFVQAGAVPVLLGSHVLRSSTAGPAAIVATSIACGRW